MYPVRYEDLLRNPIEVFAGIVRFCGLPCDDHRVRKAVAFSSFGELQAQERSNGFCERPERSNAPFFRSGESGRGAEELPLDLAQRLSPLFHAHWFSALVFTDDGTKLGESIGVQTNPPHPG